MVNLKVTVKNIFTILFLASSVFVNGQPFEKTFQGWWAATTWTFEFHKEGTYVRKSSGHFGNTSIEGKYKINNDTIILLTGYGTPNDYYLLDKDSMLIDLYLRYDYKPLSISNYEIYSSKIREIKYPQIQTNDQETKSELEQVLNLAFNSSVAKKYYHFDKLTNRKLLIANYYNLTAKITIDTLNVIFKPKSEIQEKFFVEFEDINQNQNQINFEIKIFDGKKTIWISFDFSKFNGQWTQREPFVVES